MPNLIRILVIDDNRNWQRKLPEILKRIDNDVQVDVAATYADALWYINSQVYTLATVDLSLVRDRYIRPKTSKLLGLELIQAFRESPHNANCSLIILTGYPMPDRAKQILHTYHITDFIDKGEFDSYHFIDLARSVILERGVGVG